MKPKISIVVPVYNEERAIANTISEIHKVMSKVKDKYEVIAVNDGSRDGTSKILSKVKNIVLIDRKVNKGYGASLKEGIKTAQGEYIVITDADGTYPIKDIPKLLKHSKDYDMVVGARSTKNIPFMRKPAKFVINNLANFLSGYRIPDLNSGLRVFRKDLCLKFWKLYPEGFSFTSTITMASLTNGYSVKYIPIDYYKRQGTSSIHPIKDTIGFLSLISRLSLYFNPLKVFLPLSAVFFIFSLARATRDYIVTVDNHIGNLALLLFFMSFQLFFFGLLADIINKKQVY